jgi:hypothetical protein
MSLGLLLSLDGLRSLVLRLRLHSLFLRHLFLI